MNDELVATVEGQYGELEEATARVEPEDDLLGGHVIVGFREVSRGLDCMEDVQLVDAVAQRRVVDLHAT